MYASLAEKLKIRYGKNKTISVRVKGRFDPISFALYALFLLSTLVNDEQGRIKGVIVQIKKTLTSMAADSKLPLLQASAQSFCSPRCLALTKS
jgi:hypothetical protein